MKFKTKVPIGEAWQARTITTETAPQHFNGAQLNVGVVLGPSSKGLTDTDLDCAEAVAIAPYVLPQTAARFGRKSKRESHRLYTTNLAANAEKAVFTYRHPFTGEMFLELRIGGGAQTVFPGSMHESGEQIVWEEDGVPTAVEGAELRHKVAALAAYSMIARHWPGEGSRHEAALALGGFLSRAGLSPIECRTVAEAIAKAARDPQWRDRCTAAEDLQPLIKKANQRMACRN